MKNQMNIRFAAILGLICLSITSHAGPATDGPTIGSPINKLFGNNSAYSATMEIKKDKDKPILTQVFVDGEKLRHELDMSENLKQLPPQVLDQMKKTGMSKQVILSLPEKNAMYQIQPGARGYLETQFPKGKNLTAQDYKIETTELGKETVEGHPCVKNKSVVSDPNEKKHEFIAWNATDLNGFPVKIQATNMFGETETTTYRNIKLAKPDAKLFEIPAGYKKYSDIGAMMQDMMMKSMSAGFPQ